MRQVMTAQTEPTALAVARIGLGIASVMTLVEGYVMLNRVVNGSLAMPVASWIPGPHPLPLVLLLLGGVAAGLALAVGFRSTLAASVCALAELGILLWDQQTYSNHRVLLLLMCTYLAFARSGAAWSVDAARGRGRASVPYWPQLLMMSQLSVCYLFAGLSKINPVFLQGHLLDAQVWWGLPDEAFPLLAVATVLVEVLLAVALWFRRSRAVGAVLGVLLHVSIITMLRDPVPLVAFALMCVPLYPLYFSRGRTRRREQPDSAPTYAVAAT